MAAAARHEFKLNGTATFYIRKMEPFLALHVLGELQKKFLGPLATLFEGVPTVDGQEMEMKSIIEGLEKISEKLDGATLVQFAKMLLNGDYISVVIAGEPAVKLDEGLLNRATDNIGEVIELMVEVIKENYIGVFTLARNRIGQARGNTEMKLAGLGKT